MTLQKINLVFSKLLELALSACLLTLIHIHLEIVANQMNLNTDLDLLTAC